jgi:hypothetical protein
MYIYKYKFVQGRRYAGATWGQAPLVKKKKKKQFFLQSNCKLYFIFLFTFLIFFFSLSRSPLSPSRRPHSNLPTTTKALCPPRRPHDEGVVSAKAPARPALVQEGSSQAVYYITIFVFMEDWVGLQSRIFELSDFLFLVFSLPFLFPFLCSD